MSDANEILVLHCPVCGERFPSALQMDRATFERIRLTVNFECCRFCSSVSRYKKVDYSFAPFPPTS